MNAGTAWARYSATHTRYPPHPRGRSPCRHDNTGSCLHRHADRSRTTHQQRAQRSPSGGRPAPRGGARPAPSTELASHTAKPVRRPHAHTHTTAQRTAKRQERAAVQQRPRTGPFHAPPPCSPHDAPSTAALFMVAFSLRPVVVNFRFTLTVKPKPSEFAKCAP